jgi:hypothetical protein
VGVIVGVDVFVAVAVSVGSGVLVGLAGGWLQATNPNVIETAKERKILIIFIVKFLSKVIWMKLVSKASRVM